MSVDLAYGEYEFYLKSLETAHLPFYKGSVIHGALAAALKKTVCALRLNDCRSCILSDSCIFSRVFNHEKPCSIMVCPSLNYKIKFNRGCGLRFKVVLFGEANKYISYLIYSLNLAKNSGIGKRIRGQRGKFVLEDVTQNNRSIYNPAEKIINPEPLDHLFLESRDNEFKKNVKVRLIFLTPFQVDASDKENTEVPFGLLWSEIFRRTMDIIKDFGNNALNLNEDDFLKKAEMIEIMDSDTMWQGWNKYDFKEKKYVSVGGIVGDVTYVGDLGLFIPFLRFCEKVHIGKNTSIGFGKIKCFILDS